MTLNKKGYFFLSLFSLVLCFLFASPTSYAEASDNAQTNVGIHFSKPSVKPNDETNKIPDGSSPTINNPSGTLPQTGEITTLLWSIIGVSILFFILLFIGREKKTHRVWEVSI